MSVILYYKHHQEQKDSSLEFTWCTFTAYLRAMNDNNKVVLNDAKWQWSGNFKRKLWCLQFSQICKIASKYLCFDPFLDSCAEIMESFSLFFWRIEETTICFWDFLTFSYLSRQWRRKLSKAGWASSNVGLWYNLLPLVEIV